MCVGACASLATTASCHNTSARATSPVSPRPTSVSTTSTGFNNTLFWAPPTLDLRGDDACKCERWHAPYTRLRKSVAPTDRDARGARTSGAGARSVERVPLIMDHRTCRSSRRLCSHRSPRQPTKGYPSGVGDLGEAVGWASGRAWSTWTWRWGWARRSRSARPAGGGAGARVAAITRCGGGARCARPA